MTIHVQPGHPPYEAKFTVAEFTKIGQGGRFTGYASLFGVEDLSHDIIMPSAFDKTLTDRDPASVKMLYQHNPAEPVGRWDVIRTDRKGLYVEGHLMLDLQKAREVHVLMQSGVLDGLSIGFKALSGRRDAKSGVRRLHAVDLWEISVVTFPMLQGARISRVSDERSPDGRLTLRGFERLLVRDAGLSRKEARLVARSGYRALLDGGDAGETNRTLAAVRRAAAALRSQEKT